MASEDGSARRRTGARAEVKQFLSSADVTLNGELEWRCRHCGELHTATQGRWAGALFYVAEPRCDALSRQVLMLSDRL